MLSSRKNGKFIQWGVIVIVTITTVYVGPLLLKEKERKKLKHFRFFIYVTYSTCILKDITFIIINLLLIFKIYRELLDGWIWRAHAIICSTQNKIETPDKWHDKWDKVFKSGPSEFCGRQPLKNLLSLLSIRYFVPNDIYTCIITFADLLQRRNVT